MNLAWLTANGAPNKPIPLPVVHPVACPCPVCRHPADRRTSLLGRFRAASAPGELEAIAQGGIIGILLMVLLVLIQNFDVIVAFAKGLW